jgi:methionine-rich copper-binding protein CopC
MRILLTLIFTLASFSLAQAHAFLDHAEPKVGSTLTASPSVVKIWFTMEVQGALTKIEVFDATGREVDKKDSKVDAADNALMIVSVPKLEAGTYKVVWHAVCPWGHHTTGSFAFKVTEPSAPKKE